MEALEEKVRQSALSERRLNPDQQRYYLGTFAERVVLTIPVEEMAQEAVKKTFEDLLPQYVDTYAPLFLKLAPRLKTDEQLFFMTLADKNGIPFTIIDDTSAKSPFALVLHTDHAVNLSQTSMSSYLANKTSSSKAASKTPKKTSFWRQLFNRK
ncbi:YueI family protein [Streptococcus halichoeri]|uniref:YueI family protein n=1 Tax=Streptococcus halichoeri TaxID=254785 RepID=UPI00135C17F0|nr:YueI family protein [Streptococcus halichoeri]